MKPYVLKNFQEDEYTQEIAVQSSYTRLHPVSFKYNRSLGFLPPTSSYTKSHRSFRTYVLPTAEQTRTRTQGAL